MLLSAAEADAIRTYIVANKSPSEINSIQTITNVQLFIVDVFIIGTIANQIGRKLNYGGSSSFENVET